MQIQMGRLDVMTKELQETSKKILISQPLGSRTRGKPRLRWSDEVDEDN